MPGFIYVGEYHEMDEEYLEQLVSGQHHGRDDGYALRVTAS